MAFEHQRPLLVRMPHANSTALQVKPLRSIDAHGCRRERSGIEWGANMGKNLVAVTLAAALCCAPAGADVTAKAPDGMIIQIKAEVALDRDDAWARLVDISSWWSGDHTYSKSAKSLSVDAVAGGCWCELWNDGEVEHGRVVMVMPKQAIRFDTALGPLQQMGVAGMMTITLADGSAASKTTVTLDYQVSGSSLSGLDKIADIVNQVLTEQVTRYASGE